jgi:putative endonuclease
MEYKQKIGKFGENLAISYLIKKGYTIIAQNVRNSYPEIDIIAKIKEKMVFVEVKSRVIHNNEPYEEVLTKRKIHNLKNAIFYYFNQQGYQPMYFRADLIIVELKRENNLANIKHYMDIF